jgi:hypothetical protein
MSISMKKNLLRIPFCASIVILVFGFGVGCSHPTAPTNNPSSGSLVFSKWTVQVNSVPGFVRSHSSHSGWDDLSHQLVYSEWDDTIKTQLNFSGTIFKSGLDSTISLNDSLVGFRLQSVLAPPDSAFSGGLNDTVCLDTRSKTIKYLEIDSVWRDYYSGVTDQASASISYSFRNIPYTIDAKGNFYAEVSASLLGQVQMTYSTASASQSGMQRDQITDNSNSSLDHLLTPADSSRIIIRTE